MRSRETFAACVQARPSRSNVSAQEKEWTELWRIKVPSKVRVFLWRLARISIPTGDVRHQRNMAPNECCALCGAADSWRHALLECNLAMSVWPLERENITEFLSQVHWTDARAWLVEVMNSLKHEEVTRVVVRLWAVWFARHKRIHENQFQSPFSTYSFVERFIGELDEIKQGSLEVRRAAMHVPRWIRPPGGLAKINVDAALSKNSD